MDKHSVTIAVVELEHEIHRKEEKAKVNAVRKVSEALRKQEGLRSVTKLRQEYEQRKAAIELHLSSVSKSRVEEARKSLERLGYVRERLDSLTSVFRRVDDLGSENRSLFQNFPMIEKMQSARANLSATINLAARLMSIPTEVRELRKEMVQGWKIMSVYSRIGDLMDFKYAIEHALVHPVTDRTGGGFVYSQRPLASAEERPMLSVSKNFKGYLDMIAQLYKDFFHDVIFEIFREMIVVSSKYPETLVSVAQIIEKESRVNHHILEDMYGCIVEAMLRLFASFVNIHGGDGQPSSLSSSPSSSTKTTATMREQVQNALLRLSTMESLDCLRGACLELHTVKHNVEPCFPPKYGIFGVFIQYFDSQIFEIIDRMQRPTADDRHSGELSNAEVLELLNFLDWYNDLIENELMADRSKRSPEMRGMNMRFEVRIVDEMRPRMKEWAKNILITDTLNRLRSSGGGSVSSSADTGVSQSPDGYLFTQAPSLLFRMIQQQYDVGERSNRKSFQKRVARLCLDTIQVFQESFRTVVVPMESLDWPLDLMCAMMNNTMNYIQFLDSYKEKLAESIRFRREQSDSESRHAFRQTHDGHDGSSGRGEDEEEENGEDEQPRHFDDDDDDDDYDDDDDDDDESEGDEMGDDRDGSHEEDVHAPHEFGDVMNDDTGDGSDPVPDIPDSDFDRLQSGFIDMRNQCANYIIENIIAKDLQVLLDRLYADFEEKEVTDGILATFGDYFDDFNIIMFPTYRRHLLRLAMSWAVKTYVDVLFVRRKPIIRDLDTTLAAIDNDRARLEMFFSDRLGVRPKSAAWESLSRSFEPLRVCRDFLYAQSQSEILDFFAQLVRKYPDCNGLEVVDAVLRMKGFEKKTRLDWVDACKEVQEHVLDSSSLPASDKPLSVFGELFPLQKRSLAASHSKIDRKKKKTGEDAGTGQPSSTAPPPPPSSSAGGVEIQRLGPGEDDKIELLPLSELLGGMDSSRR